MRTCAYPPCSNIMPDCVPSGPQGVCYVRTLSAAKCLTAFRQVPRVLRMYAYHPCSHTKQRHSCNTSRGEHNGLGNIGVSPSGSKHTVANVNQTTRRDAVSHVLQHIQKKQSRSAHRSPNRSATVGCRGLSRGQHTNKHTGSARVRVDLWAELELPQGTLARCDALQSHNNSAVSEWWRTPATSEPVNAPQCVPSTPRPRQYPQCPHGSFIHSFTRSFCCVP